jgi:hypothetical protein
MQPEMAVDEDVSFRVRVRVGALAKVKAISIACLRATNAGAKRPRLLTPVDA